jgi:dTDP-glucose 4,6-dehydratase
MAILVTGGAGFIGSNFIINWLESSDEKVINLDKLTYAGNLNNLSSLEKNINHIFVNGDIANSELVTGLLKKYNPRCIVNFAAESHVDRSIHGPIDFIQTNIVGTFKLLEVVRGYWSSMKGNKKFKFRFLHVSTDEVYGSLDINQEAFSETSRYMPNSPYSASKASSDHLVRAYFHTYGLPVLTTNCSNNYGPYQFPEKLIPLVINNALCRKDLPIYGDGKQIRDWLYVDDHCNAIRKVINLGDVGEIYNIGGNNEKTNLEVVLNVCSIMDRLKPREDGLMYKTQIKFIDDRIGHDRRYAINSLKIQQQLGWEPSETFHTGMEKTVEWYLKNLDWINNTLNGEYKDWIDINYS